MNHDEIEVGQRCILTDAGRVHEVLVESEPFLANVDVTVPGTSIYPSVGERPWLCHVLILSGRQKRLVRIENLQPSN